MENTDVASTPGQTKRKTLNLARTIFMVLLVMASLLLGFYTGTRYGLDVATNAALEFLEYKAADPVEIDLELLNSEPVAIYGSDNADKNVKVFIDLQCPSCSTFMEESLKNLQEDKTVRIEFYDYPSDAHKYSRLAAAYSRCAVQQGVDYLSYIGHLNADYSEWTSMLKESNVSEYLLQAAIKYGADEDMMNLCVIGNDVYQAIDSNVTNAAVLGVEGTPSFIIGNHLITGYVSRKTFNSMMNEFSN